MSQIVESQLRDPVSVEAGGVGCPVRFSVDKVSATCQCPRLRGAPPFVRERGSAAVTQDDLGGLILAVLWCLGFWAVVVTAVVEFTWA